MNNKNTIFQTFKYVIFDWLSAVVCWTLFFLYRPHEGSIFDDANFWVGVIVIPLCWLLLYMFFGSYNNVFLRSRLHELGRTILSIIVGVIILFFVIMLDDEVKTYRSYYSEILIFFSMQFILTVIPRYIIMSRTNKLIQTRKLGFNTLIIGSHDVAVSIYKDIENQPYSSGNKFVGFVNVIERDEYKMAEFLPHLGFISDVEKVIKDYAVEEVIIAFERSETEIIDQILFALQDSDVVIKIIPMRQDIYLGNVKQEGIFHSPLIRITPEPLHLWQRVLKRLFDIIVSCLVIVLLSPLYLFTAYKVRRSSPGPIFYRQERIGLHGKVFNMLKFRSMYIDSESAGPALSQDDDPRITPWGKFMRKVRLDEIPQFFTVLKGDMSIVGYRPERQFFIDQIVQKAPHYRMLLRVKPGITSWGEVKFGYASNVDEMVERLKYDILYLENMSLMIDLKILIYTVKIVVQGRGK